MNEYDAYYLNQAGTGIIGFRGVRYQRGHGLFGRFFKGLLPVVLKYLGKKGGNALINIADDVSQGKNLKESAKTRMKETGKEILNDAADKIAQVGRGRKRKLNKKSIKAASSKNKKQKTTRKSSRKIREEKKYPYLI